MTPYTLAISGTESGTQRAVMAWAAIAHIHGFAVADLWAESNVLPTVMLPENKIVPLKWLHHIPNGGGRGNDARTAAIRGANLKAEGVKAGIFDLSLPAARRGYHGLYIELKKPGKRSDTSAEQKEFQLYLLSEHYYVEVLDHWRDACNLLTWYLGEKE